MKRLSILFTLILLSTLSYGQSWTNVSNSLQRKIVGTDTLYRINMGAPGFWNISDAINAATSSGVTSFNSRTGAITPLVTDYSAFFPVLTGSYVNPSWITSLPYSKITDAPTYKDSLSATSPIFYNSSTGVISSQAASTTLSGYVTAAGQTIGGIKSFTATRTVFDGTLNMLPADGSFGTGYGGIYLGTTNKFNFKRADISSTGSFDFGGLTLQRTYIFPNANGTVALTSDIPASLPTPNALTAGYGLTGSSFDGSTARTFSADTTSATGLVSKPNLTSFAYTKTQTNTLLDGMVELSPASAQNGTINVVSSEARVIKGQATTTGYAVSGYASTGIGINGEASGAGGTGGKFVAADGQGINILNNSATAPTIYAYQTSTGNIAEFNTSAGLKATISNAGDITGNSFVKSGGLSTQFLKADGSVDGNTYITPTSTNTLTNKSGAISQWTNDSGYLTSASGVTSLAGTADEVEVSASTGAVTVSLPATINANTTGNAATATLAATATNWGGYAANLDTTVTGAATSGFIAFDPTPGIFKSITVAETKTALGITGGPFLPLTGGTLTGNLEINKANSFLDLNSSSGASSIGFRHAGTYAGYIESIAGGGIRFGTGASATIKYTIDASGNNTWTGRANINGATDDADIALNVKATTGAGKYIMFGRDATNAAVFTLSSSGALTGTSATFISGATPSVFNTTSGTGLAIENSDNSNKRWRMSVLGSDYTITEAGVADWFTVKSGGNVGIGTTSPNARLVVAQANAKSSTGIWTQALTDETSAAAGVGGGLTFLGYKTGTSNLGIFAAIDGFKENGTSGNEQGGFRIWTSNGTNLVTALTIASNQAITAASNLTAANLISNDQVIGTGNLTIGGTGAFTGDVTVPDEAYGTGWNGSLEVPTKNALYDKIETIATPTLDIVTDNGATTTNAVTVGDLTSNTLKTSHTDLRGSVKHKTIASTGNATLSNQYYTLRSNAFAGNITYTLPAAGSATAWDATYNVGVVYIIKKIDSTANTVTIDGDGAELIDGAATKVITTQYSGYVLQSNGTSWDIVGTF